MCVFKTKVFARFARRERIADASLVEAIKRADAGLIDADLGGGLIKQRVARAGRGRSGGYRMIVAFRTAERAVFLFGFSKNERDNISQDELDALQTIAASWLGADTRRLKQAQEDGILIEVCDDS